MKTCSLPSLFRLTPVLAALLPLLAHADANAPATQAPAAKPKLVATAPAATTPRATAPAASAPAVGPKASPAAKAGLGLPTVAIDIGRKPDVTQGQAAAPGQAEFAFNQRLADQLARALLAQQVAVKRIPAGLTPAQRARAAAGTTLLVSVNHEVLPAAHKAQAAGHRGYALAVSRQQAKGAPAALECARQVAAALLATGRPHSLLHGTSAKTPPPGGATRPWADSVLGVQAQDELPVLKLAPVPALRLQLAVLGNPAEAQRTQDAAWTRAQAQAVAKGLAACLAKAQGAV